MARWSREDRTVEARLVYYGPAGGGKTTNLEALHRAADARRGHELLTVETGRDGTLFFELLPLRLEEVLGQVVEIKLYSVPGQVRLDATRRVVLAGADAIVFVADSRPGRRDQNLWSLQNLRMNMRAKELDPARVPVVFQANRRDAPDAATLAEMADWLGAPEKQLIPAVASRGEGVLETLDAACRAVLGRAPAAPDGGPDRSFQGAELAAALERALTPWAHRLGRPAGERPPALRTPIVLAERDPLEGAIQASVRLGEQRSVQAERARRLALEADGFRRLGEALCEVGAGADALGLALAVARDVLEADGISLIVEAPSGSLVQESCIGREEDPLLGSAAGRRIVRRLMAAGAPCVIDDLGEHHEGTAGAELPEDVRSLAGVPLPDGGRRALVAYAGRRAGPFEARDVKFLSSVARHLVACLDKARAQQELSQYRERLDRGSSPSRHERRSAERSRRGVDRVRECLLADLTAEMRAGVASLSSAAAALGALRDDADPGRPIIASIVAAGELLRRQLDDLVRLVCVGDGEPLQLALVGPQRLLDEALRLAGHAGVHTEVAPSSGSGRFDLRAMGRAVANLIDNAVKFSPPGAPVHVRVTGQRLAAGDGEVPALGVSVLDRGPGVREQDRERIFAPFARGATQDGGLGVGLYEARSLARRHGGTLEVASRDGGGSEFRLTVPLQPIAAGTAMEVVRD